MKKSILFICILLAFAIQVDARGIVMAGGHVAEAAKDYTPAYAYMCISDAEGAGSAWRVHIYTSANELLTNGTSSAGAWSSGGPKWESATFTNATALTPGNTYRVGIQTNGGTVYFEAHSTGYHHLRVTGLTYPTPPSTIAPTTDTDVDVAHLGIRITNAAGTTLLGDETCAAGDNKGIGSGEMLYFDDGFVCVTQ